MNKTMTERVRRFRQRYKTYNTKTTKSTPEYPLTEEQKDLLYTILRLIELDAKSIITQKYPKDATWIAKIQFPQIIDNTDGYYGKGIQREISLSLLKRVCTRNWYNSDEKETLNGYRDTFRRIKRGEQWFLSGVSIQ